VYHEREFDSLLWEGVLIGYSNDYSTYKVIQLDNLQIINVKHVYFEENILPSCPVLNKSLDNLKLSNNLPVCEDSSSLPFGESQLPIEENHSEELLQEEIINEKHVQDSNNDNKIINSNIDESNILTYSRHTALISTAPKKHNQAIKGKEINEWKKAEKKEYKNMDQHKAWLVRKRQNDNTPLPLMWAFWKKLGASKNITEFKARILTNLWS
jgi:hypothetical protein